MTSLPATQLQKIEIIWAELISIYGQRFIEMWKNADIPFTKNVWAKGLSGLSDGEIRTGLNGCLNSSWPPSLPEFRELCRPKNSMSEQLRGKKRI